MPSKYVCPICDSSKIGREEAEKEYCCDDCCSFFEEPKLITTNKEKGEDNEMGNRYKLDIDRNKIRDLVALNKTIPEIAAETGYKPSSIRSALQAMGLKAKRAPMGKNAHRPRKSSSKVITPEIKKPVSPKDLADITLLDVLIAARNMHQAEVFKLNQAIEILS